MAQSTQSTHHELPAGELFPAGQCEQYAAPGRAWVPAAHVVHAPPAKELSPAAQPTQSLAASLLAGEVVPASQLMQKSSAAAAYVPAAHAAQVRSAVALSPMPPSPALLQGAKAVHAVLFLFK